MSSGWAILISLVLLAANAFFVAAEFALVASKRYRLEHAAATGGRADRAALAGSRELSMMLAGAQLGITLCTLGLGALAEPAIEHLLSPLLHGVGLPEAASHIVAFLLGLIVVTFLHLVIGEMMPKSWAITDPERSARLLALPFRGFARVTRPALVLLNAMANGVLRLVKVQPQDQLAQVHGPAELNMLLEQSRERGLLAADQHELLTSMLTLQRTTLAQVLTQATELVTVSLDQSAERIEQICHATGRSRLAVVNGSPEVLGMVHVRDAVKATTAWSEAGGGRQLTAADLMTEPFRIPVTASVTQAVTAMQSERAQLALVTEASGTVGFIAMEDLLEEVIGEFDDETDAVPRGRRLR